MLHATPRHHIPDYAKRATRLLAAGVLSAAVGIGVLGVIAEPASATGEYQSGRPDLNVRTNPVFGCLGQVVFVGVRGSGEPDRASESHMGPVVVKVWQQFARRMKSANIPVGSLGLSYEAIDVPTAFAQGNYGRSYGDGLQSMGDEPYKQALACRDVSGFRMVYAGFSQGAHVVGDYAQLLNPANRADARELAALAGIALVGDPRYDATTQQHDGAAAGPGVFTIPFGAGLAAIPKDSHHYGRRPTFSVDLAGKVRSYCSPQDVVCDTPALLRAQHLEGSLKDLPTAVKAIKKVWTKAQRVHNDEGNRFGIQAGNFLADKVLASLATSPIPHPTTPAPTTPAPVPTTPAPVGGFHTSADSVRVRESATTQSSQIDMIGAAGTGISIVCQASGETVSLSGFGTSAIWDKVDGYHAGYISDLFVKETRYAEFDPQIPRCGQSSPDPGPPPGDTVTTQMRNAADWAIAEKNSADPTWSDHWNHAWSGWCEQFASQAEGFPQPGFGSAMDHYRWHLVRGRIHTDANPPVGAVVFWDGGDFGHVAVSIGGGQAIGTYGWVGQRLPVRQYPVVGFLSNHYLGWANPIGS